MLLANTCIGALVDLLCKAFQASGNVDRRPEQVAGLIDHITKMDADPGLEVFSLGAAG